MSNANQTIRERLKAAREAARAKRDERNTAREEREAAKLAFTQAQHDGPVTSWPEYQAAEEAVRKLGTIDDSLADLKATEQGLLALLGENEPEASSVDIDGLPAVSGWNARHIMGAESPYRQAVDNRVFTSSNKFGTIQFGEIASRDDAVRFLSELPNAPAGPVDSPGTSGLIQPDRRGLIPTVLRPLRFLDLIPTGTTDSNSLEYVQVIAIPGTSGPVAEGQVKPQVGLTTQDATAPVRTIAGWIKVNRQAMDDAAGLATMINTLLPYDVRRKIEYQVIRGDGTGQNLTGILNMTGLGAPAFVTGDNSADAVLRAMTTVILSEAEPNFAAIHPLMWQDILLMRENADRSGMYLSGGPFSTTAQTLWGLALTPTIAVDQAAPLVGDSMGVTLLVREGVNVKASDSDQDDFIRNRVTILAEARVAAPVWRPASFAVADTTAT